VIATSVGAGALIGGFLALRVKPRRPLVVCFAVFGLLWTPQLILLAMPASVPVLAIGGVGDGIALTFFHRPLEHGAPASRAA